METSEVRLFIGIPAYSGIEPNCFSCLNRLQVQLRDRKIESRVAVLSYNSIIYDARNRLLQAFLASGCTHALFMDSDISFFPETVFEILSKDREFIAAAVPLRGVHWDMVDEAIKSGLVPVKNYSLKYNVALRDSEHVVMDESGLIEVTSIGLAFSVLRRSLVEKMVAAYPQLVYESEEGLEIPGLFLPVLQDRKLYGEDLSFCYRWKEIGGKIWVLANAPICHTGPSTFEGNLMSTFGPVASDGNPKPM